jgi:dimethylargininase
MFRNAIVRYPSPSIKYGLTASKLGEPDYLKASEQHSKYVNALLNLGLSVKALEKDDHLPDSTFIEDVALCTPHCAIITNPGVESRRAEINGMRLVLEEFYDRIEEIIFPGTLEAGDVMMVGNHFYIGISKRTNTEGADQLIDILGKNNMTGSKIHLNKLLHLKSGVSYIENDNILVCGEFVTKKEFEKFNRIVIDSSESYAANSLWINGVVLVPEGFPETREKVERAGYQTMTLDVSEFRKIDGGLSCLSLRF